MIDADTINELPVDIRDHVRKALAFIGETGIIQRQIRKERARIIEGDADQPIEEAAAALLDVRKRTQALQSFQEICQTASNKVNRNA